MFHLQKIFGLMFHDTSEMFEVCLIDLNEQVEMPTMMQIDLILQACTLF